MARIRTFVLLLALGAASCAATRDSSYISGESFIKATDPDLYPVEIVAVNGRYYPARSVRVEPGTTTLILRTKKKGVIGGRAEQAIALEIWPCQRYYIMARHADSLSSGWTPEVVGTKEIANCIEGSE